MSHPSRARARAILALGLAGVLLAACDIPTGPSSRPMDQDDREAASAGRIFGEDGLVLFGGESDLGGPGEAGIGVNAFLWRASLDTIAFMPLVQADPAGGVIITDWYVPPEAPNERYKVNLFILDRQLRADGLRTSVFREVRDPSGQWVSAPLAEDTATQIENAILKRARQMRIDALAQQ